MNTKPNSIKPFEPVASYRFLKGSAFEDNGFQKSWDRYLLREEYIKSYGYPLISAECVNVLVDFLRGHKVLDAGSGTGFLSRQLGLRGLDVTCVDIGTPYPFASNVVKLDIKGDAAVQLPGDYSAVLLAWPCYESPFAEQVLAAMKPGQLLVYLGEDEGGCCASNEFFELVGSRTKSTPVLSEWTNRLNDEHIQFDSIHDSWQIVERV